MVNACGISAAESNRVSLRYIEEDPDCWAVTPTSGITRELRLTASSLAASKETQTSTEIRADRMVSNIIEVGASTGGDVEGLFSIGTYDDFFQAYLGGTWSRTMGFDRFAGNIVSFTDTDEVTIAGADYTDYFAVDQILKTEGFLNEANNAYWTVATVSFTGGNTVLTFDETTAVAESGTAYGVIMDANDVILRSANVRAGTGGANAFDTNSNDEFAAAISAGDLRIGQRIAVEGLGYDTGTVTFSGVGADGETITISDGEQTVVFEIDNDSAYTAGNIPIAVGGTAAAQGTILAAAINDALRQGKISVFANDDAAGEVTVKNFLGFDGAMSDAVTNATTVDFTAGSATFGVYTITGLTSDTITVAEPVATNANSGSLVVTFKGSHLRNPGVLSEIKKRSFTIETAFTDVQKYLLMKGLRVGSFQLSVSAGEMVTCQYTLAGRGTTPGVVTTLNTAPYDPIGSTTTEVLNATVNVGEIRKNGTALTTGIQSIELTGESALREQGGVGSKYSLGIGVGQLAISGTLEAYFETLDLYYNFINHDTIALSFDFQDNDGNFMTFTLPAIKITSDPIAPSGIDADVTEQIEFAAQRDPTLNTEMMIDRMSSLQPVMG